MKSGYAKSVAEQTVNLAELRSMCAAALDRNRNRRQVLTLLVHYSRILREDASLSRHQSAQARAFWRAAALQRSVSSFAVLAKAEKALEMWRYSLPAP